MDLFNDFLVPMAVESVTIWFIITATVTFIFYKSITDVKKRNKIITGYLFLSFAMISFLIIMLLSFADK